MKIETNSSSDLHTRQPTAIPKVFTTFPVTTPVTSRPKATTAATTITSDFISKTITKTTSTTTKYHRAAIDGYVDMLCDASKKDTNYATGDCAGFTPTLLAAHHGHLDALRILVGKGGDPEKTAADGSNALHLAAAKNHLNCVSFLVNFGVNMWALDNELHTAKDVAAIEQRKEVLDYLDQMMAKQSALNTKNVQKLKEKAKVATEKRLKQMRKAQLKAIKQVEKDEKYLIKLSNNRRLLKAAHSISDIKLVGRSDAISFAPSDRSSSSIYSKLSDRSLKQHSILQEKFPSSNTSNFINHKMCLDRLKNTSQTNYRYTNQLGNINQFKATISQQLKPIKVTTSHSDESAYGSSISSTSGYLSSCGDAAITIRDKVNYARPRYSDLVAVNNELPKLYTSSSSSSSSTSASTSLSATKLSSNKLQNNEQQSVKSNSTIGTKLRGFGGVSRKVQLKRLLLINASSSNDLTTSNNNLTGVGGSKFENRSANNGLSNVSGSINNLETNSSVSNKLCNVQPAIKLKLSSIDPLHSSPSRQQQQQQQNGNQADSNGNSSSGIKWPPAPAMTRAVSEPDLGSKLRLSNDDDDEQCDHDDDDDDDGSDDDNGDNQNDGDDRLEQSDGDNDAQQRDEQHVGGANELMNDSQDKKEASIQALKANNYQHKVNGFKSGANSENSMSQKNGVCAEESQHHLLTKCLSQLKLRHQESINKQQQELNENLELTKARQNDQSRRKFGTTMNNTSNELLQHQINAGQSILKPSIIKQQQQQMQSVNNSSTTPKVIAFKQQYQFQSSKATTISVDSIGSASSLVKRNQSSSSSKSDSHSSTSPASSISYSSSYASSFEASKPSIVVNMSAPTKTVQAGTEQLKQEQVAFNGVPKSVQYQQQQQPHIMRQQQSQVLADKSSSNSKETIATFLLSNGLFDLSEVFAKEKIDLEALMLLSEDDLKSLNILLGPRRKLLKAIEDRRRDSNVGQMYVMVDTPL